MSWIHTVLRKPTKDDGGENGIVLVRREDGGVATRYVDSVGLVNYEDVAWMPIPPFTPLPPLPDGYRLLTNYSETPDNRAMILNWPGWIARSCSGEYDTERIYCVPINPPWVPAIATAGVLKPGTWLCIDSDGSYWASDAAPKWNTSGLFWSNGHVLFGVAEQPQITGEHAIWQVPE